MQDDNQEKKLGDLLRQHQENQAHPYEEGAWESFERYRQPKIRPIWYWAGGIAASFLLLWAVGSVIWSDTEPSSTQEVEYLTANRSQEENEGPQKSVESEAEISSSNANVQDEKQSFSTETGQTESLQVKTGTQGKKAKSSESKTPKTLSPELATGLALVERPKESLEERVVVSVQEDQSNPKTSAEEIAPTYLSEEEAKAKLMAQVGEEILEEDQKESKSGKSLALGFGSGFGASGGDEPSSGSSLNLGVLMGLDLGEKLTISSGLGVNYFNQASERQLYAQAAGFASAVRETQEVRQVQVDIPLYVTYPVTSNGTISVQAGFSNLIAFNQSAQLESNYTRQIAVADTESAFSNTLKLQSQPVTQVSELPVPDQRFYPFATANFGVNIRIFERQHTSYALMPFYNYPLQEFAGAGQKLGFYGASFKILFGQNGKK